MSIEINYQKSFADFKLNCKFSMPDTGVSILFGPSGSGKTTLLNCIAGLEKADTAFFQMGNLIIDDASNRQRLPSHKRRIAYVFQDGRLFPHLTARQNLQYGFQRAAASGQAVGFEEVIDSFNLRGLLDRNVQELSGGEKQRAALARALLSNPRMLILDEPMSALDYAAKQELIPYLNYLRQELTIPVIYVSHDIKEVLQLGDYMLVIDNGEIIDSGDLVDLCVSQPLLTHSEGTSFILEGRVQSLDTAQYISTVDCGGNAIHLSGTLLEMNQNVRILVHAKDVSLSTDHARGSSILNILPVVIDRIHDAAKGKQLVECLLGEARILALLSIRSVKKLSLQPGMEIFAQFKATAMVR